MKKFILSTFIYCIPFILLIISTNYFIDPAKLFNQNYEDEMVDILMENKFVTNISNYKERIFQEKFIKKLKYTPEVVVLGSSRARTINTEMIGVRSLINNSVSGASIEDLIGIYQMYIENDRIPKKIILGIDPWTLNENNDQVRWKSISEYYYRFKKSEGTNARNPFLNELVSISYFQSSIKKIVKGNKISSPTPTITKVNNTNTMLSDGSNVLSYSLMNISQEEVNEKVKTYLNREQIYGLRGFNEISTKALVDLELFLTELESRQIDVVFYLSPYHPQVWRKIEKGYKKVLLTESLIKGIAIEKKISVKGSFNPLETNVNLGDFRDGMHIQQSGVNKILLGDKQ